VQPHGRRNADDALAVVDGVGDTGRVGALAAVVPPGRGAGPGRRRVDERAALAEVPREVGVEGVDDGDVGAGGVGDLGLDPVDAPGQLLANACSSAPTTTNSTSSRRSNSRAACREASTVRTSKADSWWTASARRRAARSPLWRP
jgi:hypothetical protein